MVEEEDIMNTVYSDKFVTLSANELFVCNGGSRTDEENRVFIAAAGGLVTGFVAGAAAGSQIGKNFGPKGAVVGTVVGATVGAVAGAITGILTALR